MVIIFAPLTVWFGLCWLFRASGELWIAIINHSLKRFPVVNCGSVTGGDFPPIPGSSWLALLLLKAGDVETNPGPKHTRTQVWICDICHREITRKQTSLRCNHSEHWVHLRCAHIRVDQYTDTWICHLHRGSRLPHATYTSPHFPLASSKPLLHSPPTPPTPPHPKHQHTSNSPTSPPKMTNPRLPKPLTRMKRQTTTTTTHSMQNHTKRQHKESKPL